MTDEARTAIVGTVGDDDNDDDSTLLKIGSRVLISGVKAKPELNGTVGVIVEFLYRKDDLDVEPV